jgi:hypothetical protein
MVRLALMTACCVLALGTAAEAQITNVTGAATSNTVLNNQSGGDVTGSGTATGATGASNYASAFSITDQEISFESGNTSSGVQVGTTSVSRIDFNVTNTGDGRIAPTLTSQITAAGMGMYLANVTSGCASNPQTCAQSQGTDTFSQLGFASRSHEGPLAAVSFDFQILQDGQQLYDLNGSLQLLVDGHVIIDNETGAAAQTLNGFTTLDKFGQLNDNGVSDGALGFAWDATDTSVDLNPIGSFATSTISYIVTVSSSSQAACLDDDVTCLVAYAGFGDPIGRGGGISSNAAAFSPLGLSSFGASFGSNAGGPDFINGVSFTDQTLKIPQFDSDGNIVLTSNGVPEPATWLSMILGFGVMGAALRRRRVLAYN